MKKHCSCRFLRPGVWTAFVAACTIILGTASESIRAGVLEIPLIPELDWYGDQIETVQIYESGGEQRAAFGIWDTGASVVTLSAADQEGFSLQGNPVPIKVPGGAQAGAIDGTVVGDVSQPVSFWADGIHAVTFNWSGLSLDATFDLTGGVSVPGVQVFVGTYDGSAQLPNIAGTPIHLGKIDPSDAGAAALVDMRGYALDLGELFADDPFLSTLLAGMVYYMPDLTFVQPGLRLTAIVGETTDPVRIPLAMYGDTNHPAPGNDLTVAPNPIQPNVSVADGGAQRTDLTFLLDTGASVSVISSDVASSLGLDLNAPETTIDIVGAAGAPVAVPGYVLDELVVPYDSDLDGTADSDLRFTNAPVFVIDFESGLDGILGMNLWNSAAEFLYDPWDPLGASFQATFYTAAREIPDPDETDLLALAAEADPLLGNLVTSGPAFPRFSLESAAAPVPEPAALVLFLVAACGVLTGLLRKRFGSPSAER
ncbi:hypothetical protein JCM19992_12950 [Thermostilla marina]